MKHYMAVIEHNNNYRKLLRVYSIVKNSPIFLFGFKVDTRSFISFETATMNALYKNKYLKEREIGETYLESRGKFKIFVI